MAEKPLSTTRRSLLGAAAALPVAAFAQVAAEPGPTTPVRPERSRGALRWTRRLTRYRRLAERTREAGETGFFRAANDRYNRERAEVEARFGTWEAAASTAEGRKLRKEIFARVAAAEEAFYNRCTAPMQRAAVTLARTPAPDVQALLAKIRVMQAQQLDELDLLGSSALEVLADDVARLTAL